MEDVSNGRLIFVRYIHLFAKQFLFVKEEKNKIISVGQDKITTKDKTTKATTTTKAMTMTTMPLREEVL